MPTPEAPEGWAWFAGSGEPAPSDEACRLAARCFGTPQGALLLGHLRRCFLDRRLPPTASDAELRHVEGQRSVVAHLIQLVERGRAAPAGSLLPPNAPDTLP